MGSSDAVHTCPETDGLAEQYPDLAMTILQSIPSSALILDHGLRVTLANRNFLEKAQRTPATTLGRHLSEVFPAPILSFTRMDQRARAVLRTGKSDGGGKMMYRAPGVPQHVYFYSLTPLLSGYGPRDRAIAGVLLLMHDITEQERLTEDVRRIERHLASVVESANDLVISVRPGGEIMTWNPAAERVSGLRALDVVGKHLPGLCVPEDSEQMALLLAAVREGVPAGVRELSLQTATPQPVPVAWACSPMRDDQGRTIALVAIGRDLTERRRLEAQLQQSAKMASLGVMAGGIAHELRNPLGVASAAAELMVSGLGDHDLSRECADKIRGGIKRASVIIESLLRFARPASGRLVPVPINEVVSDTVTLMQQQAALAQVSVVTELPPGLLPVWSDRGALQQVFTNLFLNACQAMPHGGRLLVRTYPLPNEPFVGVDFDDTGTGIPAEILGRIFDPFFTTRAVGQGVGLGLAISYSLVRQCGGSFQVGSTVGSGSTFTVRLPTLAPDLSSRNA
ncbi:MAG: PAS domain-containing sensor histidine kinase [Anaerolineae bacterium]